MNTGKTKRLVEMLNEMGVECSHEYQDMVSMVVEEIGCDAYKDCGVIVNFGHNNETWGASVSTSCGVDLGYIETNLNFEDSSIEKLAVSTAIGYNRWKKSFKTRLLNYHLPKTRKRHEEIYLAELIFTEVEK